MQRILKVLMETEYFYFGEKYYFCLLRPYHVLSELRHLILNELPLDDIKIPLKTYNKDDVTEFMDDFKSEEQEKLLEIKQEIINYLEKNKFKIDLERKIEIFSFWMYYLAGSNYFIWKKNKEEIIINKFNKNIKAQTNSMEITSQIAKSIMYELDDFSRCFDYKPKLEKQAKQVNSIYDEMVYQSDIITRAICSQYTNNVKLLVENGLKLENVKYEHKILKSPLHWAYFCDNIEIFSYLVDHGCQVDLNDEIFYNRNYKKNFKFALMFYLIREKIMHKNDFLYKQINFDRMDFMEFNLYEYLNEKQTVGMFESLNEIGFDFMEKSIFINYMLLEEIIAYDAIEIQNSTCSQLFPCLCQKGINLEIIKYITNEFKEQCESEDIFDDEIAKALLHITFFYATNLYGDFYYQKLKLRSIDLLNILKSLFPLLNKRSASKFQLLFTTMKRNMCLYGFSDLFAKTDLRICFAELEDMNKYLFSMINFEILDIFVRFNFFSVENYLKLFEDLIKFRVNLDQLAPKACCLIIYLLNNSLLDSKKILDEVEGHIMSKKNFVDAGYHPIITKESRDYCENKIIKVYSYEIKKVKSLLFWAKQAVRSSIGFITNHKLETLNLSKEYRNLILKTDKLREDEFNEIFL